MPWSDLIANIYPLLISLSLGLSLPLVGVFVILRKEALLSDALAHVILLGIALAIVFKVSVVAGIFVFALVAAWGINAIRNKADLGLDAVVGVFFTTALAAGALLIPSEELLEAFLGDLENITKGDVLGSLVLAAAIAAALLGKFREFAFASFAPDLARVDKLDVRKYELLFILVLALAVAMGIKLVGTLLISALIIVPAAAAKIFTLQIRTMALWSMLLGIVSVLGGLVLTAALKSPPGPTIVLVSSAIFLLVFLTHSLQKSHP